MQNKNAARNIQLANQCRRTRTSTDQRLLPQFAHVHTHSFSTLLQRGRKDNRPVASIIFPVVSKAIFVRRKRLR